MKTSNGSGINRKEWFHVLILFFNSGRYVRAAGISSRGVHGELVSWSAETLTYKSVEDSH